MTLSQNEIDILLGVVQAIITLIAAPFFWNWFKPRFWSESGIFVTLRKIHSLDSKFVHWDCQLHARKSIHDREIVISISGISNEILMCRLITVSKKVSVGIDTSGIANIRLRSIEQDETVQLSIKSKYSGNLTIFSDSKKLKPVIVYDSLSRSSIAKIKRQALLVARIRVVMICGSFLQVFLLVCIRLTWLGFYG